MEVGVALCDSAFVAAGGRSSPAADDERRVPAASVEAEARGFLGDYLKDLDEQPERCVALLRQAVALWRQIVRKDHGEFLASVPLDSELALASQLANLAGILLRARPGGAGTAEAEALLREALQ